MSYDYYDLEQSKKESQTFLRLTKMYGEKNPYKDEYPLLGKMPIVQFLAEYNEIKKDPSKVKIKSFEEWKKYW